MPSLDALRTFVRVYELGSMSAAGRDLRISSAVTSARIAQLEEHLGVRLFQRTTRRLSPTEQGRVFYDGTTAALAALTEAEAAVSALTETPRGLLHLSAPLGLGRRLIAPEIPDFADLYPQIDLRLRLSDRRVDLTAEGIDVAFILGRPADSSLRLRAFADCPRLLCAAPAYIAARGMPDSGPELEGGRHDCLNLRFPGATEFHWTLQTAEGARKFRVSGRFECDDGDVLTDWALAGRGIVMKPVFEIAEHLARGRLVPVARATPPLPVPMACLITDTRRRDPKIGLLIDFMAARLTRRLRQEEAKFPPARYLSAES
jgi:DNA-binding transcriptional LysR family regulator